MLFVANKGLNLAMRGTLGGCGAVDASEKAPSAQIAALRTGEPAQPLLDAVGDGLLLTQPFFGCERYGAELCTVTRAHAELVTDREREPEVRHRPGVDGCGGKQRGRHQHAQRKHAE